MGEGRRMTGTPSAGWREGLSGEMACRGGLRQPLLVRGWGSHVPSARPLRLLPCLVLRVIRSVGHAGTCSVTSPGVGSGSLEESLTPGTEAPGGPSSVSWCLGVSVSGAAALTPGSPGAPGLVTGDAAGSKGAPSSARAQVITVTRYPG